MLVARTRSPPHDNERRLQDAASETRTSSGMSSSTSHPRHSIDDERPPWPMVGIAIINHRSNQHLEKIPDFGVQSRPSSVPNPKLSEGSKSCGIRQRRARKHQRRHFPKTGPSIPSDSSEFLIQPASTTAGSAIPAPSLGSATRRVPSRAASQHWSTNTAAALTLPLPHSRPGRESTIEKGGFITRWVARSIASESSRPQPV